MSQSGDLKRLPLIHQTMFAELLARGMDADFSEQFPENGSFRVVESKGRSYWYYVGYKRSMTAGGKPTRPQMYVGPCDDPEITARVQAFSNLKADYQDRRKMVASLRSAGLPTPHGRVGEIVDALAKAGIFRLRSVLVGTVAFQCYAGYLGTLIPKAMSVTGDADFAQFHSISMLVDDSTPPLLEVLQHVDPTFQAVPHIGSSKIGTKFRNAERFEIEFLVPNRGSDDFQGKPTLMPALGGHGAEPLRFLDFLIFQSVRSVMLHKAGVVVNIPAPERYAIHKIIISTQRKDDGNGRLKATKDVLQAGALIQALKLEGRGVDAGFAWIEAWQRGEKWSDALKKGFRRLKTEEKHLLRELVTEASETFGKNANEYGFSGDELFRYSRP